MAGRTIDFIAGALNKPCAVVRAMPNKPPAIGPGRPVAVARCANAAQNVTSPGGTTAAALDVLMGRDALTALMTKAVAAATKRSRRLAG